MTKITHYIDDTKKTLIKAAMLAALSPASQRFQLNTTAAPSTTVSR